jgi:hypothetical protein
MTTSAENSASTNIVASFGAIRRMARREVNAAAAAGD